MTALDNLNLNQLISQFDPAYLARGMDYFKKNRVQHLALLQDTSKRTEIEGVSLGSNQRLYHQTITLTPGSGAAVQIAGECSCPVGHNCKHVAAVCLALLDRLQRGKPIPLFEQRPDSDPVEQAHLAPLLDWLNRLDAMGKAPAQLPAQGNFIAYLLHVQDNGHCTLSMRMTRIGANGKINKGRHITPSHLYSWEGYTKPGVVAQDQLIAEFLDLLPRDFNGDQIVQGRIGQLCLQSLAESGRCFFQDAAHDPLQVGESLRVGVKWDSDGQQMQMHLDLPPDTLAIATEPPMYVKLDEGRLGELQVADFNAAQAALLLQAPVLPEALAEPASEHMLQHFPQTPVPTPKPREQRDLGKLSPTPCLTLHSDLCVSLHFDYAGHPVHPENTAQPLLIHEQGERLRIQRDQDQEAQAQETLIQAGLDLARSNRLGHALTLEVTEQPGNDSLIPVWIELVEELLPQLAREGWRIEQDPDYAFHVDHAEDLTLRVEQNENDWFSVGFDLRLKGQTYPLMPLIAWLIEQLGEPPALDALPSQITYSLDNQHHVRVPTAPLRPVIENLLELFEQRALNQAGELELSLLDAPRLARTAEASGEQLDLSGAEAVLAFGQRLNDFQGIAETPLPQGLHAELRAYQHTGLNWLQFLREYHLGGVLADDMGLGKTLQTLAHIQVEKEAGRLEKPVLIVAPTSLMSNWRREAERFTPQLKVLVLQGQQRKSRFDQIAQHDLVLTTYPLLPRDGKLLRKYPYHSLILDEAQVVKNVRSKAAQAIRAIDASHRLCLTGTPMENHLGELWAQFDFLLPGFLGDSKTFARVYRTPIEKHGNLQRRQQLQQRIAPFMLRRTKDQVAAELPAKTEILRSIAFDEPQAMLYESIRLSMEQRVREAIAAKGLASSQITILDALLKLRQICCDPRLLASHKGAKPSAPPASAKLDMLMQLVPEQLAEGRRILLFSQFTSMLSLIEQALKQQGIDYTKLTGQTRKREQAIARFTSGQVQLFLISLKAGGVGLNLTEADTVIHYDPWWNPAVESQATDRAHRIGQDKPVFVYKLIVENTVEEKIIAMQQRKRALADGVYGDKPDDQPTGLTADDLQHLFEPLPRD